MSLLQDLKNWYDNETYPPDGSELDAEQVAYDVVGERRWGSEVQIVYRRGDELVAVKDVEPATEMQGWGDYGKPHIYEVRPVQVTVTKYEQV